MNKLNFTSKTNGDVLNASEWNAVVSKTDELVQAINDGAGSGSGSGSVVVEGDSHVTFDGTDKHNLTIATTAADQYIKNGETKGGKINIEPISDLQIKSGDDVVLCSHHREDPTEVSVKIHDGEDHPVKLQVNTADIVLTTKEKNLTKQKNEQGKDTDVALYDDPTVLNVTVNSAKDTRGYLKVRAQAIDLRCEDHGGIALQPKGTDGQGNMNKVKFEHGGGDGLEFGTFNTEKTSIFTDEYRFNREGVWKMATREKLDNTKGLTGTQGVTVGNGKYDPEHDGVDETKHYSYKKQADDFYDVITPYNQSAGTGDEQCTTKDIIKTAYAMNGGKDRHTKITKKGAIEISTNATYQIHFGLDENWTAQPANISTISTKIAEEMLSVAQPSIVFEGKTYNAGDFDNNTLPDTTGNVGYECGRGYFVSFTEIPAPDIKIESGGELKLGGILDFGSSFNFGETDNGIEFQLKKTKKNDGNEKACDVLKVHAYNNHASNSYVVDGYKVDNTNHTYKSQSITIYPNNDLEIGSCSVLDIIKFVNWAKATQFGPWSTSIVAADPIDISTTD